MGEFLQSKAVPNRSRAAILSDGRAVAALLRLIAVASRQSAEQLGRARLKKGGIHSLRDVVITHAAFLTIHWLLTPDPAPTFIERREQVKLSLKLIRMQVLQAISIHLAAASELLAPQLSAGGRMQQDEQLQQAWYGAVELLHRVVICTCNLVEVVVALLDRKPPGPPRLLLSLASALRASHVMEHGARLLLKLTEVPVTKAEPDYDVPLTKLAQMYTLTYANVAKACEHVAGSPAFAPAIRTLHEVLSGCCAQHAVLCHAVGAMCALDGGSSYGLPYTLLQRLTTLPPSPPAAYSTPSTSTGGGGTSSSSTGGQSEAGERDVHAAQLAEIRGELQHTAFQAVLPALCCPDRPCPPGDRAAVILLLRMARVSLAAVGALTIGPAAGGAAGGSPAAPGHAVGAVVALDGPAGPDALAQQPQLQAASQEQQTVAVFVPDTAYQRATEFGAVRKLVAVALERARARYAQSPGWGGQVGEWWLLMVTLAKSGSQISDHTVKLYRLMISTLRQELRLRQPDFTGELVGHLVALHPTPGPEMAAAVAAGMVPCLEQWIRQGARGPWGAGLKLLASALEHYVTVLPDVLTALLSYGNPRHAASLVSTLAKLLRSPAPHPELDDGTSDGVSPALSIAQPIMTHLQTLVSDLDELAPQTLAVMQPMLSIWSYTLYELLPPMTRRFRQHLAMLGLWGRPLGAVLSSSGNQGHEDPEGRETRALYVIIFGCVPMMVTSCLLQMEFSLAKGSGGGGSGGGGGGATAAANGQHSLAVSVPATGDSTSDGRGGDGGWSHFLLEEMDVIGLADDVLRAAGTPSIGDPLGLHNGGCVTMCAAVAALFPRQVKAALLGRAETASTSTTAAPAKGDGSRLATSTRTTGSRAGGDGVGNTRVLWSPNVLYRMATVLIWEGDAWFGGVAKYLADQVAAWQAGRGDDPAFMEKMRFRLRKSFSRTDLLLPPDEARRMMPRACSNPECASLDGDSEEGLRRQLHTCGGCRTVAYCGTDCQRAHWRAGHKVACKRG